MNNYFILKTLHILSSVLLVGTGFGSAFYLFLLQGSKNIEVIRSINRAVVLADHLFTIPCLIIQPLSGWYLMKMMGLSFQAPWLKLTLFLYAIAGACWLPAYFIQIKLSRMAKEAANIESLPSHYKTYLKIWTLLGIPSFLCMAVIYYLMVSKL